MINLLQFAGKILWLKFFLGINLKTAYYWNFLTPRSIRFLTTGLRLQEKISDDFSFFVQRDFSWVENFAQKNPTSWNFSQVRNYEILSKDYEFNLDYCQNPII